MQAITLSRSIASKMRFAIALCGVRRQTARIVGVRLEGRYSNVRRYSPRCQYAVTLGGIAKFLPLPDDQNRYTTVRHDLIGLASQQQA